MDRLENHQKFFTGNSQTIYIPLINTVNRSTVLRKHEHILAAEKIGFDFGHYNDIRFLFEQNTSFQNILSQKNINLSFEYWLFDHNYPEKTMEKIAECYLNGKNIHENIVNIIDHHPIVNETFNSHIPCKQIQFQGSGHTILMAHFDKFLHGLLMTSPGSVCDGEIEA